MRKNIFFPIILFVFFIGCTSTVRPTALNQLQIQLSQMERQLDEKDQEIADLKYQVAELSHQMEGMEKDSHTPASSGKIEKTSTMTSENVSQAQRIIRVAVAPEDVQLALKNAGYYTGEVDGNAGTKTKRAIEKFQREHGLKTDGVVGEKTWSELKGYLN